MFTRPGVAGAVLYTGTLFIHSLFIISVILYSKYLPNTLNPKIGENVLPTLCVMCRVSPVNCHVSRVTCHKSKYIIIFLKYEIRKDKN